MARLNNRAFKILHTEIYNYLENDQLRQFQQKMLMQELEKLLTQPGPPATLEDLQKIVSDTYPNFSEQLLSMAAQANLPSAGRGKIIGKAVILKRAALAVVVVAVVVPNLPFPAIGAFLEKNDLYWGIPSWFWRNYADYQKAIESVKKINSAKDYAREALSMCQTQPYTASRLEQVGELLQIAITKLEDIPLNDPSYNDAQKLQAEYDRKQKEVQVNRETQEKYTSCPITGTAEN